MCLWRLGPKYLYSKILYLRRELLGQRSWEYSTLLDNHQVSIQENSTTLFSHQQFLTVPFSPHKRIIVLFWKEWSGCKVKSELGRGWEWCNRGLGTWRTESQRGSFLSSKLVVENFLLMPCCLSHRAGKNGIICFTSVINHITNCVGDQTAILCRKLLFIFYLTKLKAETVLHCALLWF